MKPIKLTRSLYSSSFITISTFMYSPCIEKSFENNSSQTFNLTAYPVIYLKSSRKEDDFKKSIIKITERNFAKILEIFFISQTWFYDTKINDLFYETESGELMFNPDYSNLKINYKSKKYDPQSFTIRPIVINNKSDRQEEGIIIIINDNATILMTLADLNILCHILQTFSFQSEIFLFIKMLEVIIQQQYTKNKVPIVNKDRNPFNI